MKVILLQDIAKVGRKGEVKEVADGFGRNFLIGRGKAVAATQGALAELEKQKAHVGKINRVEEDLFNQLTSKLSVEPLRVLVKASPEGHLFAALHEADIAKAIQDRHGINIAKSWITIEKPLKQVGEFPVALVHGEHQAHFMIHIERAD